MFKKKIMILIAIITFISSNSFAISIPFVSKKVSHKADIWTATININWTTYNMDNSFSGCDSLNIDNWRLNCVMNINGEKVISDAILLKNNISFTGNTFLNNNITVYSTVNNESNSYKLKNVLFSVYSNYSYQIDGYTPLDLVTTTLFKLSTTNVYKTLWLLNQVYVKKDTLNGMPLNSKNQYCDINTDKDCTITHIQFLKKDPITKKVNLDLLINYSK